MKERLKSLLKNKFLRNVITLSSGTFISQAVVLAASPLLARVYSVDSFGQLAIYTSFTTFLAVLSTGRYELAIGLPKEDDDALRIFKLILLIGLGVSFFYFIGVFLLKEVFNIYDSTRLLSNREAYLAPAYIFFIAIHSALNFWKHRQKRYKEITISNALQVISTIIFSIVLGYFDVQNAMI